LINLPSKRLIGFSRSNFASNIATIFQHIHRFTVHTLAQLNSGQYSNITHLTLSENLLKFPLEILSLANTLEVLDLSNNRLSDLPVEFARLKKLKRLFLTNNEFEKVPAILANCPKLEMISFKSNKLHTLDENVLPIQTRWLILTDNKLSSLPNSIGELFRLQKLALAGNLLRKLPNTMENCKKLELIRLSANQLTSLPDWLFNLPKLAWLAFSGNNLASNAQKEPHKMLQVSSADFQLKQKLGEGASGVIHQATWLKKPEEIHSTNDIAVKLFKGEVTSDGYPIDELNNCLQAGEHKNLIKVIAKIMSAEQLALVMELIPSHFRNLGLPPSLETCTRDTFVEGTSFSINNINAIAICMADTLRHLHENNVSHGDIYAHNTMIDEQANTLLGDFGAASDLSPLTTELKSAMQAVEVRAFGCLLDDLLPLYQGSTTTEEYKKLLTIKDNCLQVPNFKRPNFLEITKQLSL